MKKHIIFGLLAGVVALSSCDDFLDDNRYPTDDQTNNPDYWTSKVNLQAQVNKLYDNFTGYGSGGSWVNDFYYRSLSDDQCNSIASGASIGFAKWTYQYTQTTNSVWDASYVEVRKCNYVINNANLADESDNNHFIGIARLIRAMQYYELVRALGDVPLVTEVLAEDSPELYGPRTPRNEVMDFVLEDLNFAIANIKTQKNKIEFCVDMANAMKSEICLYEAAYAKYHEGKGENTERAKLFYGEAIKACEAIMDQGYKISDDYNAVYTSAFSDAEGLPDINSNPEVIFYKGYKLGTMGHSACAFLSTETPICGMTKSAFDSYIFKDGKPAASTKYSTSDLPTIDADGNFDISALLAVRDGRLAKTIDSKLAFGNNVTFTRENSNNITSTTGYTINKYVSPKMSYVNTTNASQNYTCAPIYWLAFTYCDYLEAKAELGTITDADIKKCMKPLWERADFDQEAIDNLNKDYLANLGDPANNMNVSSLIWEIRRLRRSELMFDKNHRYWDLVRWHQLDKLDTNNYPDIALGANVSQANDTQLDGAFVANGYINGAASTGGIETRVFTDREYLQPLGSTIRSLYNAKGLELPQNPGWD